MSIETHHLSIEKHHLRTKYPGNPHHSLIPRDVPERLLVVAELAVNLRKESLEQMSTPALETKLSEMQARLRRAEARETGAFKKHTKLQAVHSPSLRSNI